MNRSGRMMVVSFIACMGLLTQSVGLSNAASSHKEESGTNSWDKNVPNMTRFVVLPNFNSEAVLDKNTGLVWEKSPTSDLRDWASATNDCVQKAVGGTYGWRLPSVVELKSLQDPSLSSPYVPTGVFDNVQTIQFPSFWSSTTNAVIHDLAWIVQFWNKDVASGYKTGMRNVWCVRGPMNADAY